VELLPIMLTDLFRTLKAASIFLIIMSLLTGIIYPLFITALGQLVFPWQANGSIIKQHNYVVGSVLIGQWFNDPRYFWGRPSATIPTPYNASSSTGSNLSTTNPKLLTNIKTRITELQQYDPRNNVHIPIDLVTSSASGLDPDISPNAAFYQTERIATARKISVHAVEKLVYNMMQTRQFGVLGEPRINVLQLNIALDNLAMTTNSNNPSP
jgi:K+-transporting ATPase ATPase C chain